VVGARSFAPPEYGSRTHARDGQTVSLRFPKAWELRTRCVSTPFLGPAGAVVGRPVSSIAQSK
jgi:hypothetical protein